jgi:hypothetical protein
VGDREILETYLNSAPKNTSETDIFPHGTKYLLTIVINELPFRYMNVSATSRPYANDVALKMAVNLK